MKKRQEKCIIALVNHEMAQLQNAESEGSVNIFMMKNSVSRTNDTKQNQFHKPFYNFVTRSTIKQSYRFFTEHNIENNQHRTINLSTFEDNLRFIPNVKSNINTLSTKPLTPYPKMKNGQISQLWQFKLMLYTNLLMSLSINLQKDRKPF